MVRKYTIALAAGATLGASVALTPTEASAWWWYPGYSAYSWYPAYYTYAPIRYTYWAWRPYTFAYYVPAYAPVVAYYRPAWRPYRIAYRWRWHRHHYAWYRWHRHHYTLYRYHHRRHYAIRRHHRVG
jgi:hypothetical protein